MGALRQGVGAVQLDLNTVGGGVLRIVFAIYFLFLLGMLRMDG